MDQKPLPDPKELYPDPTEQSSNMFQDQKKASRRATIKNVVTALIIIVILLGLGYWFYASQFFSKTKSVVSEQINDESVKTDVARVQTVSGYYFRSYKTYEGMDNDVDYKTVANYVKDHGSELRLQGLSDTTFVAWAVLPKSGKIYCADAKNYTGEVQNISPNQTTCQ